ncbi:MAG: O-acetyl-ADP-ribose deacetylase [Planctomycetota bacterium]|nr:MAG: O-acetyl-ADP-ribose deacetylase [Planctomycetota bacterium]
MEYALKNQKKIQLEQGDITKQETHAIVNAANSRLLGGGGVDGAIHRAAGPKLLEECKKLPEIRPGVRCEPGQAVITKGYNLKAPWVIHTVGPVYKDGKHGEPETLRQAYRSCLELASQKGLASLAFPSISTGAYGYPLKDAASIALSTIIDFLEESDESSLEVVKMVLFSNSDFQVYQDVLKELLRKKGYSPI